ncbi:prostate stem cell antigen isoform X1 [Ictalurus punctatus]|uniref:Prostate stem cell antigen isoform X1 n=1 Tax=Ictalurus punctatus TaxID=7998 RepID=A0A2D0SPH6_ICTPU|nr:prostate stem cell antigen isoform X1 [Ictalurus punctatus]
MRTSERLHSSSVCTNMKTLVIVLLLLSAALHTVFSCAACKGEALKCYTCVASNQAECNRQGLSVCPANSDACATITGANSVMKSCSFKSFCDKSHMSNGGMKLECCFSDECNGPHRAHSHGEHGNGAVALGSSLNLLLGVLIIRAAVNAV